MQPTENLPRPLRRKLEAAQDNPVQIVWDRDERLIVPLSEVFHDGRMYRPGRSDRDRKGRLESIPPETFVAVVDDTIRNWWSEGKVSLVGPFIDIGKTSDGVRAYRPWPGSMPDLMLSPSEFDSTLILVRLKHSIQVFSGLSARELVPGSIFYAPWAIVKVIGYWPQSPLEFVE
jgi:hypothetical protein